MKTVFSKLAVLLFTCLCLVSTAAAERTLSFTAIPDQDTARLEERFAGIASYLEKELKVPVKYVPVKSYSASVTAFKNNSVQLAWFGGLSGVQARLAVPGSQAIAQGEEDPEFKSYIIAHKSTGLKPSEVFPKEIRGKTMTFGSKSSTSGRLMPEHFIRQNFDDESPDKIFKRVGYSGDHSKTIALVQSGAFEVGAVNYKVWDKELKAGLIDTDKVQIIWSTPGYPDYNWSVRGDIDKKFGDGFMKKLQNTIVDLKDKELLESFPRRSFIVAENQDFEPIVGIAEELGIVRR